MTTVTCTKKDGFHFECVNHSGDHDTCTICSTLCNVLVCAIQLIGVMPEVYESGHVIINVTDEQIKNVRTGMTLTFLSVMDAFRELEKQSGNLTVNAELWGV